MLNILSMFNVTINFGPQFQNTPLLSFGEVLTALAIITGFIQLLTPLVKFRIITRLKGFWVLYTFNLIAVFLVYFRSRFEGPDWLDEIALALIFLTLIFICMAYKPIRFNEWTAKRFRKNVEKIIKKGIEPKLIELAMEDILCNVKAIIMACSQDNGFKHDSAEKKDEKYEITPYTLEAIKFLDLLSDSLFCKILVVHTPDTAIAFINEIQQQGLHASERKFDRWGNTFIR